MTHIHSIAQKPNSEKTYLKHSFLDDPRQEASVPKAVATTSYGQLQTAPSRSEPAKETHRRNALLGELQTAQSRGASSKESHEKLYSALLYVQCFCICIYICTVLLYMYIYIFIKAHRIASSSSEPANETHRRKGRPYHLLYILHDSTEAREPPCPPRRPKCHPGSVESIHLKDREWRNGEIKKKRSRISKREREREK